MATFGERLAQLREKKGWSQQELAKYAGVPYMTIWRAETQAHRYPRMDIAKRIARALGVSLDVLCGLYEDDDESDFEPAAEALVGA
jgi:transcriptional regulator with XRE-family HTH domain